MTETEAIQHVHRLIILPGNPYKQTYEYCIKSLMQGRPLKECGGAWLLTDVFNSTTILSQITTISSSTLEVPLGGKLSSADLELINKKIQFAKAEKSRFEIHLYRLTRPSQANQIEVLREDDLARDLMNYLKNKTLLPILVSVDIDLGLKTYSDIGYGLPLSVTRALNTESNMYWKKTNEALKTDATVIVVADDIIEGNKVLKYLKLHLKKTKSEYSQQPMLFLLQREQLTATGSLRLQLEQAEAECQKTFDNNMWDPETSNLQIDEKSLKNIKQCLGKCKYLIAEKDIKKITSLIDAGDFSSATVPVCVALNFLRGFYSDPAYFKKDGIKSITKYAVYIHEKFIDPRNMNFCTVIPRAEILWYVILSFEHWRELYDWLRETTYTWASEAVTAESKILQTQHLNLARFWAVTARTPTFRHTCFESTSDNVPMSEMLKIDSLIHYWTNGAHLKLSNLEKKWLLYGIKWFGNESNNDDIGEYKYHRSNQTKIKKTTLPLEIVGREMIKIDDIISKLDSTSEKGKEREIYLCGENARNYFSISSSLCQHTLLITNGRNSPLYGSNKKVPSCAQEKRKVWYLPFERIMDIQEDFERFLGVFHKNTRKKDKKGAVSQYRDNLEVVRNFIRTLLKLESLACARNSSLNDIDKWERVNMIMHKRICASSFFSCFSYRLQEDGTILQEIFHEVNAEDVRINGHSISLFFHSYLNQITRSHSEIVYELIKTWEESLSDEHNVERCLRYWDRKMVYLYLEPLCLGPVQCLEICAAIFDLKKVMKLYPSGWKWFSKKWMLHTKNVRIPSNSTFAQSPFRYHKSTWYESYENAKKALYCLQTRSKLVHKIDKQAKREGFLSLEARKTYICKYRHLLNISYLNYKDHKRQDIRDVLHDLSLNHYEDCEFSKKLQDLLKQNMTDIPSDSDSDKSTEKSSSDSSSSECEELEEEENPLPKNLIEAGTRKEIIVENDIEEVSFYKLSYPTFLLKSITSNEILFKSNWTVCKYLEGLNTFILATASPLIRIHASCPRYFITADVLLRLLHVHRAKSAMTLAEYNIFFLAAITTYTFQNGESLDYAFALLDCFLMEWAKHETKAIFEGTRCILASCEEGIQKNSDDIFTTSSTGKRIINQALEILRTSLLKIKEKNSEDVENEYGRNRARYCLSLAKTYNDTHNGKPDQPGRNLVHILMQRIKGDVKWIEKEWHVTGEQQLPSIIHGLRGDDYIQAFFSYHMLRCKNHCVEKRLKSDAELVRNLLLQPSEIEGSYAQGGSEDKAKRETKITRCHILWEANLNKYGHRRPTFFENHKPQNLILPMSYTLLTTKDISQVGWRRLCGQPLVLVVLHLFLRFAWRPSGKSNKDVDDDEQERSKSDYSWASCKLFQYAFEPISEAVENIGFFLKNLTDIKLLESQTTFLQYLREQGSPSPLCTGIGCYFLPELWPELAQHDSFWERIDYMDMVSGQNVALTKVMTRLKEIIAVKGYIRLEILEPYPIWIDGGNQEKQLKYNRIDETSEFRVVPGTMYLEIMHGEKRIAAASTLALAHKAAKLFNDRQLERHEIRKRIISEDTYLYDSEEERSCFPENEHVRDKDPENDYQLRHWESIMEELKVTKDKPTFVEIQQACKKKFATLSLQEKLQYGKRSFKNAFEAFKAYEKTGVQLHMKNEKVTAVNKRLKTAYDNLPQNEKTEWGRLASLSRSQSSKKPSLKEEIKIFRVGGREKWNIEKKLRSYFFKSVSVRDGVIPSEHSQAAWQLQNHTHINERDKTFVPRETMNRYSANLFDLCRMSAYDNLGVMQKIFRKHCPQPVIIFGRTLGRPNNAAQRHNREKAEKLLGPWENCLQASEERHKAQIKLQEFGLSFLSIHYDNTSSLRIYVVESFVSYLIGFWTYLPFFTASAGPWIRSHKAIWKSATIISKIVNERFDQNEELYREVYERDIQKFLAKYGNKEEDIKKQISSQYFISTTVTFAGVRHILRIRALRKEQFIIDEEIRLGRPLRDSSERLAISEKYEKLTEAEKKSVKIKFPTEEVLSNFGKRHDHISGRLYPYDLREWFQESNGILDRIRRKDWPLPEEQKSGRIICDPKRYFEAEFPVPQSEIKNDPDESWQNLIVKPDWAGDIPTLSNRFKELGNEWTCELLKKIPLEKNLKEFWLGVDKFLVEKQRSGSKKDRINGKDGYVIFNQVFQMYNPKYHAEKLIKDDSKKVYTGPEIYDQGDLKLWLQKEEHKEFFKIRDTCVSSRFQIKTESEFHKYKLRCKLHRIFPQWLVGCSDKEAVCETLEKIIEKEKWLYTFGKQSVYEAFMQNIENKTRSLMRTSNPGWIYPRRRPGWHHTETAKCFQTACVILTDSEEVWGRVCPLSDSKRNLWMYAFHRGHPSKLTYEAQLAIFRCFQRDVAREGFRPPCVILGVGENTQHMWSGFESILNASPNYSNVPPGEILRKRRTDNTDVLDDDYLSDDEDSCCHRHEGVMMRYIMDFPEPTYWFHICIDTDWHEGNLRRIGDEKLVEWMLKVRQSMKSKQH